MLAIGITVAFWLLLTAGAMRIAYKAGFDAGKRDAQQKIASAQRLERMRYMVSNEDWYSRARRDG